MIVGLVWAQSANGVIGSNGGLPWHLPEDLALFRRLTLGSTVVMGRATWESLPEAARPLRDRLNVVLTRQPHWAAPGAVVARSLTEALAAAPGDVWVIGGASVYTVALPYADRLVVTELAEHFEGDVLAPVIGPEWLRAPGDPSADSDEWLVSRTGLRYRSATWVRATTGR